MKTKKNHFAIWMMTTIALGGASLVFADSVDNAYVMCRSLDKTGLLSEPCKVSGWHSSVDVYIDTNGGEARKICSGVVALASQSGLRFDQGWKVRIYSPYSNGRTIAQCNF